MFVVSGVSHAHHQGYRALIIRGPGTDTNRIRHPCTVRGAMGHRISISHALDERLRMRLEFKLRE